MLANPPLEMLSAFRLRGCFVKPTFKHIVYFPPTTGISNIAPEYFLNLSQIHIHVDFFFFVLFARNTEAGTHQRYISTEHENVA